MAAGVMVATIVIVAAAGVGAATVTPGATRHFAGGPLPPAPVISPHRNVDVEPGIAVTPDGTFWIASLVGDRRAGTGGAIAPNQDPLFGLSGTDIWRSTDRGASYQWVAAPFNPAPDRPGLGGGDTDIAVAPARNQSGQYNVYAVSLWAGAAVATVFVGDISLSISQDGGKTWLTNVVAAHVPLDDRPWLSADGACTLYLTHRAGPTLDIVVERYDVCDPARNAMGRTLVPVASSRLLTEVAPLAMGQSGTYVLASFARPAVDTAPGSQYRHAVYMPAMDCPGLSISAEAARATGSPDCPNGKAEVYVFRSRDQGMTWSLIPIAASPGNDVRNWQVWAATDSGGTVYVAWSDTRNVYLSVSHDGGSNWSPPHLVNQAPSRAAAFPTVAAGGDGVVEIAWYGAPVAGASDDAAVFGNPGAAGSVPWSVFSARSADAGTHFDQVQATGTVHTGMACTFGGNCAFFSGSRDLFEDFGIAISPASGLASIAYTSDQPQGDVLHDFTGFATESETGGLAASRPAIVAGIPNTGSSGQPSVSSALAAVAAVGAVVVVVLRSVRAYRPRRRSRGRPFAGL